MEGESVFETPNCNDGSHEKQKCGHADDTATNTLRSATTALHPILEAQVRTNRQAKPAQKQSPMGLTGTLPTLPKLVPKSLPRAWEKKDQAPQKGEGLKRVYF